MGKTTKGDVIAALSDEINLPWRETYHIVDTILHSMIDALSRGESIELRGFGTFKIKQYGTYIGCNPKSQQKVKIKPKKLPVFTVGKKLKEAVNNNRDNFS